MSASAVVVHDDVGLRLSNFPNLRAVRRVAGSTVMICPIGIAQGLVDRFFGPAYRNRTPSHSSRDFQGTEPVRGN